MGLASAAVQTRRIDSHTVIECHPDVAAKCLADNREALASGRMHLLTGFWQDTTPLLALGAFDGVLFDTYPITQQEFVGPHMFFFAEAHRLLRPGGADLLLRRDGGVQRRPPATTAGQRVDRRRHRLRGVPCPAAGRL